MYLKAFEAAQERNVRQLDYLNHILGSYNRLAFNDPKKYPKRPVLARQGSRNKVMSSEEMEQMARRNTIILGGKIQ